MKKLAVLAAAAFALSLPIASYAMDHDSMGMDQGSMNMDHGSMNMHGGKVVHEEVVSGVKASFSVIDMGAQMPKGMKETHHIKVEFKDAKTGAPITAGEAKVKVIGPDKKEQTKDLMAMGNHFGSDFDLSKKGKYGVICKFKVKDGKVRSAKFWYTVK